MKKVSLSVIIPAYNASGWISRCLHHLMIAIRESGISDTQIIVVDDGSSDATLDEVDNFPLDDISIVRQENLGRFRARKNGLDLATGTHVLFLDTRVFLHQNSLKFVKTFLKDSETSLWTAHVEANTTRNPIARFWRAIEMIFWRRYFKNPHTTSFGLSDFDYYPKGTTALIAPVDLIRRAIENYTPTVENWHKVNDDTALLRYAAAYTRINISPLYSCTYNARTSLKTFMRHANHRGSVLIDGYLRKGTRLNIAIWTTLIFAPVFVIFALSKPMTIPLGAAIFPLALFIIGGSFGAKWGDSLVLAALCWPFILSYLSGMYWGLILKFRGTLRRSEI